MTRIPDEHAAARELEEQFRQLGSERGNARRRRTPRWAPALAVVAVITVAGVVAATGVLDEPSESDPAKTIPFSAAERPSIGYQVDDPQSGDPWSVRAVADDTGARCARVAFISTEEFSQAALSGDLETCLRPSDGDLRVVSETLRTRSGPRSVLYGVVDDSVRSVRLEEHGEAASVLVARKGVFLLIRAGGNRFGQGTIVATSANRTQRIAL